MKLSHWFAFLGLIILISSCSVHAEVVYTTIDFSAFHNSRTRNWTLSLPEGDITLGGIPFSLPTGLNNEWLARSDSGSNPIFMDVPVNVFGVSEVHTLINTIWGRSGPASYASIEFFGSDGAYLKKDLVGNTDIRDYNQNVYTNSINGTTATNVILVDNGTHRMDKQCFVLPAQFRSQKMTKLRVTDNGGEDFQRVLLSGITVGYDLTNDNIPPTVAITSPTASSTYSTSNSVVNLSGITSDNSDIASVSWTNNRGGGGVCEGTASWSADGIRLLSGSNIITITANDTNGNYAIAVLTVSCSASGKLIYVKTAGSDLNSGLSWSAAKKTVQAALNAASSGDQVWVSAGTYVNTAGSINLKDGVALYGGFPASGGAWSTRSVTDNITILDGDKLDSVIIVPSGLTQATVIDGFTITNGDAKHGDGYWGNTGGGIYCSNSSPCIVNNVIANNHAQHGGGIHCECGSSARIQSNTISNNLADAEWSRGGGICVWGSTPTIIKNTISANKSTTAGGIMVESNSNANITDNVVSSNQMTKWCGGISFEGASGLVSNNIIINNASSALHIANSSSPTICKNSISGNENGIIIYLASPFIASNTIRANQRESIYCYSCSPTVVSNLMADSTWGISCDSASPSIINNTIVHNTSMGINLFNNSSPTIINNISAFNDVGVWNFPDSNGVYGSPTLSHNCVFGNTYDYCAVSPGIGDITQDPLFINKDAGNCRLAIHSPCINAGDDSILQSDWTEMDGKARKQGTHVDIGAYEYYTVPPTVTIQSPTASASYTTSCSVLTLSGTAASGKTLLTQVTWANDRGDSGICSGKNPWSVADVPLQRGQNIITVTVRDEDGNSANTTLTVSYLPILNPGNEHYYEIVSGYYIWFDARMQAEQRSYQGLAGHLATITSSEENAWIVSNILVPAGKSDLWLGAYQDRNSPSYSEPADGWRWVTIEPWSYHNWYSGTGEPNNTGGIEDYLEIYTCGNTMQNGQWNDLKNEPAGGMFGYLVEYEPDNVAPTIYVTSPTSTSTYVTKDASLTFSGTASDNLGIASITWANSRGGSGTCPGTASWTANGVPLAVGENVIALTATDAVGNTATTVVTVKYDLSLQVAYSNDFEGNIGSEWSIKRTDVTPVGNRRYLGQFNNAAATLYLSNLPVHTEVTITFDLFIMKSWDGNASCCGPDHWMLSSYGNMLLDTTFGHFYWQSYASKYGAGIHPTYTGAAEVNTLGYSWESSPMDSVYKMSYTVPHTLNSLHLAFSANTVGWQNTDDESWGIDNVVISVGLDDPISIGSARQVSIGSAASITDAVVTAIKSQIGRVFVESSNRSCGINLVTNEQLQVGQRVKFNGIISRPYGEFQIDNIIFTDKADGDPLPPICMTTKSIGNDKTETLKYFGLNTSGLLVRIAGKVTGKISGQNVFYLDDGYGYLDGCGPVKGIKIKVPGGVALPDAGKKVIITGISRTERIQLTDWGNVNGDWYPAGTWIFVPSIWIRNSDDLQIL